MVLAFLRRQALIFCLILTSYTFAISQNVEFIEDETGNFKYEEVLKIDGDADLIYSAAISIVASSLNSEDDEIQFKDKELSKLVIRKNFDTNWMGKSGVITAMITVQCKDGRYKVLAENLSYISEGSGKVDVNGSMAFRKSLLKSAKKKLQSFFEKLHTGLHKSQDEDW